MPPLTEMEWHCLSPLPVTVKLHYGAPDGQHALTPTEIRSRYTSEVRDSSLVVWRSISTGRFGFRAGIDELAWDTSSIGNIALRFCRPAKGAGNVLLYIGKHDSALALSSNQFAPELLDWFRQVLKILRQMFHGSVTEIDDGYDA